jgi:hypothetical protein
VAGPFYSLPTERLFVDSTPYLSFVILCLHLPCIIVVRKGYLLVTLERGRVGSIDLLLAVRYVGRHGNSGWKEADEDRTSVATSPNVSPPTIRKSKPEMKEDEPETVSASVTKEKEEVTDTKEGVSAPPPTTPSSKSTASKETEEVSHLSLPSSRADQSRR